MKAAVLHAPFGRAMPAPAMLPGMLTLSDVMGTGWFAADAANVGPGKTMASSSSSGTCICTVARRRAIKALLQP